MHNKQGQQLLLCFMIWWVMGSGFVIEGAGFVKRRRQCVQIDRTSTCQAGLSGGKCECTQAD